MCERQSVSIRHLSQDWAEQIGYYRFLSNERVSVSELSQSLRGQCQQQVSERHVLSVSDTSEINLQANAGRMKSEGAGIIGTHKGLGFMMHPSLVLDAESGFPLGISHLRVWNRDPNDPDKRTRKYKDSPIWEKESFKWLDSAHTSQRCLEAGGSSKVTHVADREADIYEEWAEVPSRNSEVLVRACYDRKIADTEKTLFTHLSEQPVEGTYCFQVTSDSRHNRTQREAWMAVRIARVRIQRPHRLQGTDYPSSVSLFAVDVHEVQPPKGETPIHWRLLTTHRLVCIEQALLVVRWYSWRWRIEQLFFTLKQGGLDLESSQLESIPAVERLCVFALATALRVLQLTLGRDDETQPAAMIFSDDQLHCLSELVPTLNGRTRAQQNPYSRFSLAWANWVIARLGGWSGLRSQRPPGSKTLFRGLNQFNAMFSGWSLARDPQEARTRAPSSVRCLPEDGA